MILYAQVVYQSQVRVWRYVFEPQILSYERNDAKTTIQINKIIIMLKRQYGVLRGDLPKLTPFATMPHDLGHKLMDNIGGRIAKQGNCVLLCAVFV